MSLIGKALRTRAVPGQAIESPPDTQWVGGFAQTRQYVTPDRALRLAACWAAVRLLADTISTLPCVVYARLPGGGTREAWNENSYRLLMHDPNPEQTPIDLLGTAVLHLQLYGDAFIGKQKAGSLVANLWGISPHLVRVARERGVKVFYVRNSDYDPEVRYTADEVIHIKGLSLNGLTGLSPIEYALHSIGGALALDEYGHRYFANSAVPRGVLTTDQHMEDDLAEAMRRRFEALLRGARNAHKVAVLTGGLRYESVADTLDDAGASEAKRFAVQEASRWFRVPPSKIGGDSGGSLTYATVESNAIDFATDSIAPWTARIQAALAKDRDLFPAGPVTFPKFDLRALLRGDTKTRYDAHKVGIDAGFLTVQEARDQEDLGPLPAPATATAP